MGTKTHTGATAVANKPQPSSAKTTTAQAKPPAQPDAKPADAGKPVAVAVAGEISAANRAAVVKLLQPFPVPSQVRVTLAYLAACGGTAHRRTACRHVCSGPKPLWRSQSPNPGKTPGATWGVQIDKLLEPNKTRGALVTKTMAADGMLQLAITEAGRAYVNQNGQAPAPATN